ncbi:hypothetical protein PP175_13235 [Aneurinibacillus sp. Ricciae_BoGa-3]|uniref:hypothetical protein n=1 Tax=Aneurinibacillus sp. Ricciae_BoGa-3 TaxID=3022697 RepID=UPI00233FE14A|nr:hypothetical protein [Aneurinibacillus sp. Ricciae_BoGa-3]WCK52422.1 hypothetical protein PP175_13235 [Aneurinibacillus sp. Ricciae_BoGa-3]
MCKGSVKNVNHEPINQVLPESGGYSAVAGLPPYAFIVFHMIEEMYTEKKNLLQHPGYTPYFMQRNYRERTQKKQKWEIRSAAEIVTQFLYALHLTELDDCLDPQVEEMACEVVRIIDDSLENGVQLDRIKLAQQAARALLSKAHASV